MSLPTRRNGGPILPFTLDDRTSSSPLGTSHRSVLRSLFRNRLFLVFCGIGLFLFTFGLPRGLQPPGPRWPKPPPPPHHGPHHHDWLDDDEFDKPLLEKAHKALDEDSELWSARAGEVKAEFLHAYHAYEKYAMPRDELRPLSKGSIDNYNGWGVTVVDSIDTMLIMGMGDQDEYERALKHVVNINLDKAVEPLPFFETTIRYLGGLLSAYALTHEPIFLSKADQLGQKLLPVFGSPTGIPFFSVDATTGEPKPRPGKDTLLAEIGTFQVEFIQLARWTGRQEYFQKAEAMTELLAKTQNNSTGMWGTVWDTLTGVQKNDKLAVGGEADSAYEYMIKSYLFGGRRDARTRRMFIKLVNGVINNLFYLSPNRKLLYVTDTADSREPYPSGKLEHLSCFLPGMIALGAKYMDNDDDANADFDPEMKDIWEWAAKGLATTCWLTYADQPSGLGPDEVMFVHWTGEAKKGLWMDHVRKWISEGRPGDVPPGVKGDAPLRGSEARGRDYSLRFNTYQLRPETVESLYVLYKTTGNPVWRDRAWEIFEAIRKHCRVADGGYSSVIGLDRRDPSHSDAMPSWFMAETLKYLFLIASPRDEFPLQSWVFNTEAHPLPVGRWRDWEKERYGLVA